MRAFIAIELPKEVKDTLAALQGKLKESGALVKWVEPANMHLTLKFLGVINEAQFDKTRSLLQNIVKNEAAFRARICSIGAFPRINSPRVIWAGLDDGDEEIKRIAMSLEESVEKIGIPREEREFSSHITIGRKRSNFNLDKLAVNLKSLQDYYAGKETGFFVSKITLFKSTLTPKGPVYEALAEANLKTI